MKESLFPTKEIMVLNGHVRLIDTMGNDSSIVQMARVSYGKGTKTVREDRGLIRYLMRHRHSTPFEACEIKLHLKMPIFVARQFVRHRTFSVNEISARYSKIANEFYIVEADRIQKQSKLNKQGSDGLFLRNESEDIASEIFWSQTKSNHSYTDLLEKGVSREIARVVMPVGQYTEWYWKGNLRNVFHFLNLRLKENAQYEARLYAQAIAEIVRNWVPVAWEAFEDYQLNAKTFSNNEIEIINSVLNAEKMKHSISDNESLSKREKGELLRKLGIQ